MIVKSIIEEVLRKNKLCCPSNIAKVAVQLGGIEPFSDAADAAQVEQAIRQIRNQLDNPAVTLEKFYDLVAPWLQVDANNELILNAAGSPLVHFDQFRKAVHALGEDRLVIRGEYADAWAEFLGLHPEYGGVAANRNIAFNRMTPYTFPSVKVFEAMIPDGIFVVNQAAVNEAEEARARAQMSRELLSYMLDENGKPKREFARDYAKKLAAYEAAPLADLKARYDYVIETRRLKKADVAEVQNIVLAEAQASRRNIYAQYEPLPVSYNGVEWTFSLLHKLDPEVMRRILRRYGSEAFDRKCNENLMQGRK